MIEKDIRACVKPEPEGDGVEVSQPGEGVQGGTLCGPAQASGVEEPWDRCFVPCVLGSPVIMPTSVGISVRGVLPSANESSEK